MSMVSTLDLIRRVPLFSLLASEQAETVANAVVKRRYKRGENIVEQGKKSNSLYILLTGRARVLSTDNRGREVILATLQVGDYIGEMSLIDGEPHSATVRADAQTDALVLGRAEFSRCLPDPGSMAYSLLRGLVRRLRDADRKIESLALVGRHDEDVGPDDRLGLQLDVERRGQHLANARGDEVRIQRNDQPPNGSLMRADRRRRHEQLAIHELVARRHEWIGVDERLDLGAGPATMGCRHGHNLLGSGGRAQ